MELEAMTLDELQAEAVSLAQQLGPLQTRHRAAHALIERRKREAAVRARLLAMPEAEKDALRAALIEEAETKAVAK